MGFFISAIYGVVGRKVRNLKESFSRNDGELAECLMFHGNIESPGIAVLGGDGLILAPIVGERVTLKLADIRSYRKVKFFNGKTLIGKTGFYLETSLPKRLGFAVVDGIGKQWAVRFRQAGMRQV
jgi:hypothetical protein